MMKHFFILIVLFCLGFVLVISTLGADLKQGVEEVHLELLSSVIRQIRGRDAALANALALLVEDFEYDEMLALIQQ